MHRGKERLSFGEPSVQTKDDDPDWMWHKPVPDKWEQFLDNTEKKSMADKYVVENKAGLWMSDRKTADWMDDWSGKGIHR